VQQRLRNLLQCGLYSRLKYGLSRRLRCGLGRCLKYGLGRRLKCGLCRCLLGWRTGMKAVARRSARGYWKRLFDFLFVFLLFLLLFFLIISVTFVFASHSVPRVLRMILVLRPSPKGVELRLRETPFGDQVLDHKWFGASLCCALDAVPACKPYQSSCCSPLSSWEPC
jgi:hypothetical protein